METWSLCFYSTIFIFVYGYSHEEEWEGRTVANIYRTAVWAIWAGYYLFFSRSRNEMPDCSIIYSVALFLSFCSLWSLSRLSCSINFSFSLESREEMALVEDDWCLWWWLWWCRCFSCPFNELAAVGAYRLWAKRIENTRMSSDWVNAWFSNSGFFSKGRVCTSVVVGLVLSYRASYKATQ